MGILPTVGVQQSIEQIPALIQASPPVVQPFPPVSGANVPVVPVDEVKNVSPVASSRKEEGVQEEETGGENAGEPDEPESESSPDSQAGPSVGTSRSPEQGKKGDGHIDLRV